MELQNDKIATLQTAIQTAYLDHTINSNLAYRPEFISNNYKLGKKVLVSIEEELQRCEEFCISVAFITKSGITPLLQTLKDLEQRNIPDDKLFNLQRSRGFGKAGRIKKYRTKNVCYGCRKRRISYKGIYLP